MSKDFKYKLLQSEFRHLRELRKLDKNALEIQAKEYERRLEDLNGEASRLRNMQASYLPREVYETEKKEVDKKVTDLSEWKNNKAGWAAAIFFIIGLTMFFLTYFKK